MTAQLAPRPNFKGWDNNGFPLAFGLLTTYAAGTITPIATYVDSTQTTQNTNPVQLNFRGECNLWLDPTKAYKFLLQDFLGNTIPGWPIDNITIGNANPSYSVIPITDNLYNLGSATFSWANVYAKTNVFVGSNLIPLIDPGTGGIGYFARTAVEITASVIPVDFFYAPGVVDRYGTNTTPGTTDMGPALQAAINVALAAVGSGLAGIPIRFGAGAYSIATKPTFGGATINILPIDIGGQGIASQLINNLTASTSPLFDMTAKNGWWIHDLLICGNSAHKNGAIAVNFTGSAEAIEWRISRVTSLVAGVGIELSNTNTGVIEGFRHWPGNNPTLIIPQTVTITDINHGIYCTGGFVHNVSIYDATVPPDSAYAPGMCGIKGDMSSSYGVLIVAPLVQTLSGLDNEFGIDWNASSSSADLTILNAYNEGTIIRLTGTSQSVVTSAADGTIGGAIVLGAGSRENTIQGCNQGIIHISDSSCFGNVLMGCQARGAIAWSATTAYIGGNYVQVGGVNYICILANTNNTPPNATFWTALAGAFIDATEGGSLSSQPTRLIGCSIQNFGAGIPDLGATWRKAFIVAGAGTFNSDTYVASWNVLRCTGATATVVAPLHPRNGQRVGFTVRNESGGALAITWSGFGTPPWTNPPNTFNRSAEYMYDSDFAQWRQLYFSGADVPN